MLDSRRLKQLHRFETWRPVSRSGLDEVLIPDARAGLTPADMVERKVSRLLEGSHYRLGDAETRLHDRLSISAD
jgi:hypothetical protein